MTAPQGRPRFHRPPDLVEARQATANHMGIPRLCEIAACRRHRRCTTREVDCYQYRDVAALMDKVMYRDVRRFMIASFRRGEVADLDEDQLRSLAERAERQAERAAKRRARKARRSLGQRPLTLPQSAKSKITEGGGAPTGGAGVSKAP